MTLKEIKVDDCRPFYGNPFRVLDDGEMDMREESILISGVLSPIVVRPAENGKYEIISGHRRIHACQNLGIETVPAMIEEMTQDKAVMMLIDSNLYRDGLLPSEKAFAYKMKYDILKHQGKTSDQDGPKLTAELVGGKNDSATQVKRYIRLTNLIKPLLDKVDEKQIALTPAVELSYLNEEEQRILIDAMDCYDCTPSYSQAVRLRRMSENGELNSDAIYDILSEEKANQRETVKIPYEKLNGYFPRDYMPNDIVNAIVRMLEERKQQSVPLPAKSDNKIDITAEIARRKAEREAVTQLSKPKSRDDSAR